MSPSRPNIPATLVDLNWMCGTWQGSFGDRLVEESWSQPSGGTMSTMVRLTTTHATSLIELILIREVEDSLVTYDSSPQN